MAFSKGKSGNPAGKPAGTKSKTTVARERQRNAVRVLENLMLDTSIKPECRLQAAALILYSQAAA